MSKDKKKCVMYYMLFRNILTIPEYNLNIHFSNVKNYSYSWIIISYVTYYYSSFRPEKSYPEFVKFTLSDEEFPNGVN